MNNNSFRPRRAKREPSMTSHELPIQGSMAENRAGEASLPPSEKRTQQTPPPASDRDRMTSDQPTGIFDLKDLRREEEEFTHLEIRRREIPKKQEELDFIPSEKPKPTPKPAAPAPKPVTPIPRPSAPVPKPAAPTPKPVASVPKPVASTPKTPAPKPMELMGIDFEYTYVDAPLAERDTEEFDTGMTEAEEEMTAGRAKSLVAGITKAVIYLAFVLTVSILGALTVIRCGNDMFAFVKPADEVTLSIGDYTTVDEIAALLYENQVIDYPFVFRLFAKVKKDNGQFVAGTYTVSPSMNYDELLKAFKKKLTKREEIRLTIPEGYTVDDIIALFVENGMGTKEGFVEAINEYEYDYWFVKELTDLSPDRKYRLEGYLYPDTYDFYKDWEETVIISRFLANFDKKFSQEYRDSCKELGYTVDDVVNLASIIQMEAKYSDEYAAVSSVLHNRLNSTTFNRRLDCDATIQYTFDERKPVMEEGDTAIDTPYNTYLHGGLPPGPISNPVMSAVDAALFPDQTNYYYFVAQKNGRLLYAKTLSEHDANIASIKAKN